MDPLHITEFASPRFFDKLKQANGNAENGSNAGPAAGAAGAAASTSSTAELTIVEGPTFTLPLGNPRQHSDGPVLKVSDQRKRSLGHDLSSLRTQRRPSFSGSFGSLRSRVTVLHRTPSITEHHGGGIIAEEQIQHQSFTLSDLFLALPNELQEQIIAPLPIHTILDLRLVSKSFHTLVALNESSIARYHALHTLPSYTLRLYPLPEPRDLTLHYLCSIWHRLHVAAKLSTMISLQARDEIFFRKTLAEKLEFEPQCRRMRQRLIPLVFTIFHFFETYRELHVQHLMSGGAPLSRIPYTFNPFEYKIMESYDDRTLLHVHQVFPLVISSFVRRLRPPSYVGSVEAALRGYIKDRPSDEIYATILAIGGLRQAQRFWETKRYNARRAAVDVWYGYITWHPVEADPRSRISRITHLGRKKTRSAAEPPKPESSGFPHLGRRKSPAQPVAESSKSGSALIHFGRKKSQPVVESSQQELSKIPSGSGFSRSDFLKSEASTNHDTSSCKEWFCVKPNCRAAQKRGPVDDMVFCTSLAAGPPMSPLSRDQLNVVLPDLQDVHDIWARTAEPLILQRKIVERATAIKRNGMILMELIKDNGTDGLDEWHSGRAQPANTENMEGDDSD